MRGIYGLFSGRNFHEKLYMSQNVEYNHVKRQTDPHPKPPRYAAPLEDRQTTRDIWNQTDGIPKAERRRA